jgi:hypothetical protein
LYPGSLPRIETFASLVEGTVNAIEMLEIIETENSHIANNTVVTIRLMKNGSSGCISFRYKK